VTVLDPATSGSGRSSNSYAWLNSNSKPALPYHRLFNSPIAEGAIAGTAVGYALEGGRALIELMYCDFLGRAGDEVFNQLAGHRIHREGMVLKPNMVIAGKQCPQQASAEQVAAATVRCLKRHVPTAVPGIAFLSGGQSPAEATLHLSLMNAIGNLPWQLTFSYGRALQDAALRAWGGKATAVEAGQKEFGRWARLNGLARSGRFKAGMDTQAA